MSTLPSEVPDLLPNFPKRVMWLAIAIVAVLLGLTIYSCVGHYRSAVQVQKADQSEQKAIATDAKATVYEQEAQDRKPILEQDKAVSAKNDAEVARRRAVVDRLRRGAGNQDPDSKTPGAEAPVPAVDLPALVEAQDQLIKAQDQRHADDVKRIADLEAQVVTLTLRGDAYKASDQSRAQEVVQLRAALAAREGLERAAEIKGFIYGSLCGYGLGKAR